MDYSGEIWVERKNSPMIIGITDGGTYVASDVPAILKYTMDVYYIGNYEMERLTPEGAVFYDLNGDMIQKELMEITFSAEAAEKGGYEHFMMKEIYEQPETVKATINLVVKDGKIDLSSVGLKDDEIKDISQIFKHWSNRALFYLSRLYCNGNIKRGQAYGKIKPALHIGILTKSPFKEVQEFYSEYYMMNPANGHISSRIYSARVLDLSQIDNVSEGQKQTEVYFWARLLLAATWEEVNMLVKERKYLQSAASHLRWLSEDEEIQEQCAARERYYMDMNSSKADGVEIGIRKGMRKGIQKGINRINT